MGLRSIAHICICTKDLEKTKDFYCDKLRLEKVFDFIRDGELIGFYLKVSEGSYFEFFRDKTDYKNDSSLRHICIETDNIKLLREDLTGKGIKCGEISLGGDQSYQFWIKDPNNVDIEFHEYTKTSSQHTGKNVMLK